MRAIFLVLLLAMLCGVACQTSQPPGPPVVVAYVSEEQVFSEPILKDFQRDTGIEVKAVYDTADNKGAGVMDRLAAEKDKPQADVYWGNEPIRAELLREQGISAPYVSPSAEGIPPEYRDLHGHWTGFAARARVFVVKKNAAEKPRSVNDYASARFKGRVALANPLFGTSTAYTAALFVTMGDTPARKFLDRVRKNDVKITSGNAESAEMVANGESDFALVDSNEAASRIRQGMPLEVVYPDQGDTEMGCMIIPNAAVLLKGAPHPENARRLIDYLLSPQTEQKLAFSEAEQLPLHPGVQTPAHLKRLDAFKTMTISYAQVAAKMREIQPYLKQWAGM